MPPYVKRAIEKLPDIKALIVPVSEAEEVKQKINRAGTNEFRLFHQLKEVKK